MTGDQVEKFFKGLRDQSITLFSDGESLAISTLDYIASLKENNEALNLQLERLERDYRDLRLLMFAFVRNSAVLPVGLSLGKSEQEITDKTFETITEARKMLDVEKVKAAMNLATDKGNRYDRT